MTQQKILRLSGFSKMLHPANMSSVNSGLEPKNRGSCTGKKKLLKIPIAQQHTCGSDNRRPDMSP